MDKKDAEKIFQLFGMITNLLEEHKVKEIKINLVRDYVERLIEIFPIVYIKEPENTTEKDQQIAELKERITELEHRKTPKREIIPIPVPYEKEKENIFDDIMKRHKERPRYQKWYKTWTDDNTHVYINDGNDNTPQFTFDISTKKASFFNNGVQYSLHN